MQNHVNPWVIQNRYNLRQVKIFINNHNILIYIIFAVFLIPFIGGFIHEFADVTYFRYYTFGLSLKDFFGVWISIFGAIGLLYNIRISGKRLTNQQIQINSQSKSERDSRFAKGIELLGNPTSSARTGAAYTLYFLAKDFREEYAKTVFDILCAHVRSITEDKTYRERYNIVPSTEIQTIVDLLFKEKDNEHIFYRFKANLQSAFLHGINIAKGNLFRANLSFTDFAGADLNRAILEESTLHKTRFYGAVLTNTSFGYLKKASPNFDFANLESTHFEGAEFTDGATFIGAKVTLADFTKTYLHKVSFIGAIITGSRFNQSFICETNFAGVNLQNADFTDACCEHEIEQRTYTNLESGILKSNLVDTFFEGITNGAVYNVACHSNIIRFEKLTKASGCIHLTLKAKNIPETTEPVPTP